VALEGAGDLALVVDGGGVVADAEDGEVGDVAAAVCECGGVGLDLGPELGGDGAAVEGAGGQGEISGRSGRWWVGAAFSSVERDRGTGFTPGPRSLAALGMTLA
jgi:hypothetical protein